VDAALSLELPTLTVQRTPSRPIVDDLLRTFSFVVLLTSNRHVRLVNPYRTRRSGGMRDIGNYISMRDERGCKALPKSKNPAEFRVK